MILESSERLYQMEKEIQVLRYVLEEVLCQLNMENDPHMRLLNEIVNNANIEYEVLKHRGLLDETTF